MLTLEVPNTTTYLTRGELKTLRNRLGGDWAGGEILRWIADVFNIERSSLDVWVTTFSGAHIEVTSDMRIGQAACYAIKYRLKCGICGNLRCKKVAVLDGVSPEKLCLILI